MFLKTHVLLFIYIKERPVMSEYVTGTVCLRRGIHAVSYFNTTSARADDFQTLSTLTDIND